MPILKSIAFLFILAFVGSCNLINPAEPIPAYIEIEDYTVSANYITQGTNSSKVKDAWVYIDGALLGVYQLPCKLPVLKEGVKEIKVGAGILENGIASTRSVYPLYKFYSETRELKSGETVKLNTANFEYFPSLAYTYFEDFESDTSGGGISMDTTSNSKANLQLETVDVFEGRRSLKLEVNSSQNSIECITVGNGYLLNRGRDIYLEMDYRCNQEFTVGLRGNTNSGEKTIPVLIFNSNPGWNKIYINLSKFVNANFDVSRFKIYFNMQLASGASSGFVYVDNVKLISN
jgi:hypothetical protein